MSNIFLEARYHCLVSWSGLRHPIWDSATGRKQIVPVLSNQRKTSLMSHLWYGKLKICMTKNDHLIYF